MRIWIDENLPRRLASTIETWPWAAPARHVADLGLQSALDIAIWNAAASEPTLIFTKDKDFGALSATRGFPPKVVLLRSGNCTVDELIAMLAARHAVIELFVQDATKGLLVVDQA